MISEFQNEKKVQSGKKKVRFEMGKEKNIEKWPVENSLVGPHLMRDFQKANFTEIFIGGGGGIKTSYHRHIGVSVGWVTSFVGE